MDTKRLTTGGNGYDGGPAEVTKRLPPPTPGATPRSYAESNFLSVREAEQAKEVGKIADLRAELDALKGQGEKQK